MSEKERKKKDGRNKDSKTRSRPETTNQKSQASKEKEEPAQYGGGLPRNDIEQSK
ncbi:MAG TPA: hypothetical protein VIG62_04225 [Blastocatellia bacterium]|jgi:hypothetical protein